MLGEFTVDSSTVGKFVILLVSIGIHEACHAFTADRLGDDTARRLGRTTWNPIRHLDPFLSVLLPGFLIFSNSPFIFGAGKPVPVERQRLKNPARDFAIVALVGPLSNLVLALLFSVIMVGMTQAGAVQPGSVSEQWLWTGISLNLLLAVLNALPIPPLDGSRFLAYLLPRQAQSAFYGLDRFGILFLIVLMVTGALTRVMDVTYVPMAHWWADTLIPWTTT
jgi:Zn-dependent protease